MYLFDLMKYPTRLLLILLILGSVSSLQAQHSDANIFGDVQSDGEHIPFATVHVEGTTIGTATDFTGHYMLIDLEPGVHTLVASSIGYSTVKKEVTIQEDEVLEVNFELKAKTMAIDEVVITGTKTF